jgi:hypothetical protein
MQSSAALLFLGLDFQDYWPISVWVIIITIIGACSGMMDLFMLHEDRKLTTLGSLRFSPTQFPSFQNFKNFSVGRLLSQLCEFYPKS